MRYRILGQTGLRVSEMALGTMTFGNEWGWGADRAEAGKMFDRFAEAGGNFIDTADRYTNGTSERFVGELVAADRERFVVATKYTLSRRPGDPNAAGNHRKSLVHALDASLERLGLEFVDLYWVHVWDQRTPIEETMAALDAAVAAGKVLHVGISDTPAWVVSRANAITDARGLTPFAAYQGQYSLIERTVERDVLPMSRSLGLTFTAWGALGSGILSGKYLDGGGEGGRVKKTNNDAHADERNTAITRVVVAVAQELGVDASQVALRWVHDQPGIVPILGVRTIEQLEDNLGALEITLGDSQRDRLDRANRIDLGFPHNFGSSMREMAYGGTWDLIDP